MESKKFVSNLNNINLFHSYYVTDDVTNVTENKPQIIWKKPIDEAIDHIKLELTDESFIWFENNLSKLQFQALVARLYHHHEEDYRLVVWARPKRKLFSCVQQQHHQHLLVSHKTKKDFVTDLFFRILSKQYRQETPEEYLNLQPPPPIKKNYRKITKYKFAQESKPLLD